MKKTIYIIALLLITIVMLNSVSAQEENDTQITDNSCEYENTQIQPETINIEKSDIDSINNNENTESNGDYEGEGCCSTIIQGYNNDSAISFRRDSTTKVTLNVKNNSSFIKQYKSNSYFFHVIISKNGWLVGNGGEGGESVNKAIESYALSMINNNQISTTTMNKIYNIKSQFSLGHFVIKAPNGTYSLIIKNTKTYKDSGVLKAGQYLVVPNNSIYFLKGTLNNVTDEKSMISNSRLLAAKDKYGVPRRQIVTYYYKNNYYNSTVKISVSNDNGKYVSRSTENLIDNVQTNSKYYSSSSIPIIDKYLDLGAVNFILRNQSIPTPTKLVINEIKNAEFSDTINITGRYMDISGLNLTFTPLKMIINSVEYTVKTDGNGVFSYTYKADTIGLNNVTVSYQGNKRFKAAEKTITFNVRPKTTVMTIDSIDNTQFNDSVIISGRYTDSNGLNLTYTPLKMLINSCEYGVKTDGNGVFSYTYKTNTIGTNNVTVSYPGNKRFKAAQESMTFNVTPRNTIMILNSIDNTQFSDSVIISGRYIDSSGLNLTYTPLKLLINSMEYKVKTDGNGVFSYTYKTNTVGLNNVTVSYDGNKRFYGALEKTSFNVVAKQTKITIKDITKTKDNYVIISGKYTDITNLNLTYTPLTISVDGSIQTVKTNQYGEFEYKYKPADTFNKVVIYYNGNKRYAGTSQSIAYTIDENEIQFSKSTIMTINNIKTVNRSSNVTISGKYTDLDGTKLTYTPVKIDINGKIYTTKTDGNGEFTINYIAQTIGVHNITASYHGNMGYSGTTAKTSFIVLES